MIEKLKSVFEQRFNEDEGWDLAKMPSGDYADAYTADAFESWIKGFEDCYDSIRLASTEDDPNDVLCVYLADRQNDDKILHMIWEKP